LEKQAPSPKPNHDRGWHTCPWSDTAPDDVWCWLSTVVTQHCRHSALSSLSTVVTQHCRHRDESSPGHSLSHEGGHSIPGHFSHALTECPSCRSSHLDDTWTYSNSGCADVTACALDGRTGDGCRGTSVASPAGLRSHIRSPRGCAQRARHVYRARLICTRHTSWPHWYAHQARW